LNKKNNYSCTICKYVFDLNGEGGSHGMFGTILVSFCPTCYSCLLDWVNQLVEEKLKKNGKE
tara:strand:- start:402 stop:587 length:186 start_codon:yes stop_codon:yes gene_type:complete